MRVGRDAQGAVSTDSAAEDRVGGNRASLSSSAAQSPWSRIITPGFNACDGWPKCRFEGPRREVRLHMRECLRSDAGALYRVLRGSYGC
jgi:hypothetical protein